MSNFECCTAAYSFPLCSVSCFTCTKSPMNKEQSIPFKTALMKLTLMLNRAGDRMLPCGTPISCLCSSDRVELTLTLKECYDRNLWINLERWPLNPRSPEVCQNTMLPRCVVSLLKVKENSQNVLFFNKGISDKHFKMSKVIQLTVGPHEASIDHPFHRHSWLTW